MQTLDDAIRLQLVRYGLPVSVVPNRTRDEPSLPFEVDGSAQETLKQWPDVAKKSGCPLERQLFLVDGTIPQVQVDKMLIRHAKLIGQSFKIRYCCAVQSNRNGLLEQFPVGIPNTLHLRKVVLFSHPSPLIVSSFTSGGFPCRDDPDNSITFPVAMADNQNAQPEADTQHEKAIFVV